jgi:FkbM family methyltransferase
MPDLIKGYDEQFVSELYRIMLDREPDATGLDHHLNALQSGVPPHEIVATFMHSQEFMARMRPEPAAPLDPAGPAGANLFDQRLLRLEALSHGGRAVYLGNGRILTKVSLGAWNLGYLLEADDLLLAPHLVINGYHEIDITNFFIRNLQNGNNCLDVGANFGYFTCIMGRWSPNGKTLALEPDRKIFELLRDNIYINSLEGVAVARHAAASDKSGMAKLYRRVTRSGNTSITRVSDEALAGMGEPASVPFEVSCIPIDTLLPEFGGAEPARCRSSLEDSGIRAR